MPAEQLEAILDSPAMREAASIVVERSQGGTEELQWIEVKDELSSEQWGRLIREGVLVESGTGFALAEPDRVAQRLSERDEGGDTEGAGGTTGDESEEGDESWAWYDKVAGGVTLVLFAGYWNSGVRDLVASLDDLVLAPVTHVLPFYAVVLVLAAVTGLYSTILQDRLMDSERLQAYQDRMAEIKERKRAAKERGDEEALDRIQKEQMEAAGDQMGMFKLQFRPMVWIMLLTIPVFLWLRWKVRGGHMAATETGLVVPLAGSVTWQGSLFGPMPTWIVWYFLCSMAARQVIQKTLDVQGLSPGGGSG